MDAYLATRVTFRLPPPTGPVPPIPRPRPRTATRMPIVLAAVRLACGAPDDAPPASASRPDSARDSIPGGAADAHRGPSYDETSYLDATKRTDPDSLVNGPIENVAVLDSVLLGRRNGARVTALLVRLGPGRDPDYGWYRVYEAESSGSGRVARATELDALGSVPRSEVGFGAVDLDGDGMREPYIGHWTGGTQGYIAEVDLLVPRRRHPHWYMLEGFYGTCRAGVATSRAIRPLPARAAVDGGARPARRRRGGPGGARPRHDPLPRGRAAVGAGPRDGFPAGPRPRPLAPGAGAHDVGGELLDPRGRRGMGDAGRDLGT